MDKGIVPIPKGIERIILVDDDEELAKMNKRMLESLGYKVTALTNSIDTLDTFQKEPDFFDLVLTDKSQLKSEVEALLEKLRKGKNQWPEPAEHTETRSVSAL